MPTDSQMDKIAKRFQKAIDPRDPIVRNFAASIAAGSPGSFNVGQLSLLWLKLKKQFRYVNDPKGYEYLVSASQNIQHGLIGDCDDAGILMTAMLEAVGGTARTIAARGNPGHVYAECYVGKLDYLRSVVLPDLAERFPHMQTAYCHQDAINGCWLNMDTLGGNSHPGGTLFTGISEYALYTNGTWEAI